MSNTILKKEQELVEMLGDVYNAFLSLEKEHRPAHCMDNKEFCHAIHTAQNIVLARIGMRILYGSEEHAENNRGR